MSDNGRADLTLDVLAARVERLEARDSAIENLATQVISMRAELAELRSTLGAYHGVVLKMANDRITDTTRITALEARRRRPRK